VDKVLSKEGKREFVEPRLIKYEEPLDKITVSIYGGSQTDSNDCNWFEKLFNLDGC
jgi:hypothetical protein